MGHFGTKQKEFAANAQVAHRLALVTASPCQKRQLQLRRIGVFEYENGEFKGEIATVNFKCKALIRENPYRVSTSEPEWIVQLDGGEVFQADLGYAWDKKTEGEGVAYKLVHIDDPAFPKTIEAVLVKGAKGLYYLYWDRVTIADEDIERMYITEELIPYTGVLRPIDKPTDYLMSIYPSLTEQWGYDFDD